MLGCSKDTTHYKETAEMRFFCCGAGRVFPNLQDTGDKITIDNLLHMTNGIPDVYDTANFVCGIREDTSIHREEF